ncbi:MAG: nucleotide exchange factor GrpE [Pseudomonadota bacterium]|nr:nucleotide exchange factor GrpE [Pseudomonadota bacterium]
MGEKRQAKIQTENQKTDTESESLPKSDPDQGVRAETADPLSELKTQLESAQKEAGENYDRLLRVSADFENYKKRSAREMEDFRKFANESLIKALLPVIDNLERALDSAGNNQHVNDAFVEGVQLTLSEVLKIFEKFNVNPIESLEKPFDPGFHQAVMQQETDNYPDKTVLTELQKGYLMHAKLIRPAMVVVSKKKEIPENQENDEQLEITKKEMIISDSEEDTANG